MAGAPASEVRGPTLLFDTSAAVPLVLGDHEAHLSVMSATMGSAHGLSGHAWFETYSVLTRLPAGQRRSPVDVRRILDEAFPESRFLDAAAQMAFAVELPRLAIAGGAVYDALVGAAARAHDLLLATRDRRAKATYDALGVRVLFID